jgi:hypothetical protein
MQRFATITVNQAALPRGPGVDLALAGARDV